MLHLLSENIAYFLDRYDVNLLNIIFISFTTLIVLFGSLMNLIEPMLPNSIRQSFRYGKHKHTGQEDKLISKMEVPKSWFAHFYVFAFTFALWTLYLVLKGIIMHEQAPAYVLDLLDIMAGSRRKALIDSNSALVATVLMTLQCGRRFYETNFVQIFSKKSKINISHYMVGYIHYFCAILALIANTEGFVRGKKCNS